MSGLRIVSGLTAFDFKNCICRGAWQRRSRSAMRNGPAPRILRHVALLLRPEYGGLCTVITPNLQAITWVDFSTASILCSHSTRRSGLLRQASRGAPKIEANFPGARGRAFQRWSRAGTSVNTLREWIKDQTLASLQHDRRVREAGPNEQAMRPLRQLNLIQEAIASAVEGSKTLEFDADRSDIVVQFEDGQLQRFLGNERWPTRSDRPRRRHCSPRLCAQRAVPRRANTDRNPRSRPHRRTRPSSAPPLAAPRHRGPETHLPQHPILRDDAFAANHRRGEARRRSWC